MESLWPVSIVVSATLSCYLHPLCTSTNNPFLDSVYSRFHVKTKKWLTWPLWEADKQESHVCEAVRSRVLKGLSCSPWKKGFGDSETLIHLLPPCPLCGCKHSVSKLWHFHAVCASWQVHLTAPTGTPMGRTRLHPPARRGQEAAKALPCCELGDTAQGHCSLR